MSDNRRHLVPKASDELDSLKQETAEELHLDDDIAERGWGNMTTREVGTIGGNMVRKMVEYAETEMDAKDGRIDVDGGKANKDRQRDDAKRPPATGD